MVQIIESDPFEEQKFIVTDDDLAEFRRKLYKELERQKELYHPKDVEAVKSNYEICRRYVRHKRRDIEAAVEMAKKSLQWRNEFGVNDIAETNIYRLYLNVGCFIPFKKDKLGSQCIIFRTKLHRKNSARSLDMKRYLVFWVEKCLYELNNPRMTFVFDSTDATYASMDIEQITFIIELFSSYYPWALGHVIVYNMPWILKTVWGGIQALIPAEGTDRFKFCNGNEIFAYIDHDCLPDFMGGSIPVPFRELTLEEIDAIPIDPEIVCYRFRPGERVIKRAESRICSTPAITKFYRDNFGLFRNGSRRVNGHEAMSIFLCRPEENLEFKKVGNVQTASFEITSCSPDGRPIVFKVKVNCLQGYTVKPFCGVLENGASMVVNVSKEMAYPVTNQDKLLVQAVVTDQLPSGQLVSEFWQKLKPDNIFQKKLRCCLANEYGLVTEETTYPPRSMTGLVGGQHTPAIRESTSELEKKVAELSARYRAQQIFNSVICFLLILNFAITFHSKMCNGIGSPRWYC
ncbi:motile sperm domain-containing protein 2-like isoform X5 [Varroa destructor]|uniref:Motile sperm domain-containing protein 2 n=1 Tax=Varroa destructor TaxID=109461 RepID=A0A7M7MEK1_VARDE|nr:motile sperm domain-containing protein 2-like isoform X5 [Varroa destructor]